MSKRASFPKTEKASESVYVLIENDQESTKMLHSL